MKLKKKIFPTWIASILTNFVLINKCLSEQCKVVGLSHKILKCHFLLNTGMLLVHVRPSTPSSLDAFLFWSSDLHVMQLTC